MSSVRVIGFENNPMDLPFLRPSLRRIRLIVFRNFPISFDLREGMDEYSSWLLRFFPPSFSLRTIMGLFRAKKFLPSSCPFFPSDIASFTLPFLLFVPRPRVRDIVRKARRWLSLASLSVVQGCGSVSHTGRIVNSLSPGTRTGNSCF